MARFEIVEGAPGQGKSLYTARKVDQLIRRNKKYYDRLIKEYDRKLKAWEYARDSFWNKFGKEDLHGVEWVAKNPPPKLPQKRMVASNMKFSDFFESENGEWILYWADMTQLVKLKDCDVIWDEIATELDARNWPLLSAETKRFLSQYRKRGIDIYANTQDFSMVDARARLMITGVKTLNKILGSPDLSTTKPPPKTIWGIILIRNVNNFKETNVEKKHYSMFDFSFMLIEKELVDIYDTRQDIVMGKLPPLRHEDRYCEFFDTPGHPCYQKAHKVIHL